MINKHMLTKWTQRHHASRRFWNLLALERDKIEDLKAGVESLHRNIIQTWVFAITYSNLNEFSVEKGQWESDSAQPQKCSILNQTWRETSQVTYVTMVPRVGNETLRPLGVATGNALSVTRSEDTYEKNTTCWPADSPWRHYRRTTI